MCRCGRRGSSCKCPARRFTPGIAATPTPEWTGSRPVRPPPGGTGTHSVPVRQRVVDAALAAPARTPRELASPFTERERHFLSESSVYRILKAYDLIASRAFVALSAGKVFQHPTHRPNELWQTDFTYLHVVSWG